MNDIIPQDDTPQKRCPKCEQWKPATTDFFARDKNRRDGFQVYCKMCQRHASDPLAYEEIPEGCKRCSRCKEVFPATLAYFTKKSRSKAGLSSRCKKCTGKGTTFGIVPELREVRPDEKQCIKCKHWFPKNTDFFWADKAAKDGFRPECRDCHKKSKKVRYAAMDETEKEEHNQHKHEHYKMHSEEICHTNRGYYATHREETCQQKKRYREEHYDEMHTPKKREERRLYIWGWRRRPEIQERRRGQERASAHNRRARLKAVPGTHTAAQIAEQLKRQHYRCYYAACGFAKFPRVRKNGKWEYVYDIEHTFPLSRVAGTGIPANDMGYLVLSCDSCNSRKHNKFPHEWFEGGRLL